MWCDVMWIRCYMMRYYAVMLKSYWFDIIWYVMMHDMISCKIWYDTLWYHKWYTVKWNMVYAIRYKLIWKRSNPRVQTSATPSLRNLKQKQSTHTPPPRPNVVNCSLYHVRHIVNICSYVFYGVVNKHEFPLKNRNILKMFKIATRGQFWHSVIVIACVCLCVRVSVFVSITSLSVR